MERMRRSEVAVHVTMLAICLLCLAASVAVAAPSAIVLRGGAGLEGPQGTLKSGPVLGVATEWRSKFGAWGGDASWAHDAGRSVGDLDVMHVGVLARRPFGEHASRPYAEGGLGVSLMRWRVLGANKSESGPDGWLGLGWEMPLGARVSGRLDARYHAIVADTPGVTGGDGNLEDYFSVGASVAFSAAGGR